jgi:glycosyltransferase involved in cell wall biosynthesis
MSPDRLKILFVSQMPASPPRFGAQARMHGLMTQLARRHDLTAVMLVDQEFDIEECYADMRSYCRDVVLVPNPHGRNGLAKRLLQLRSIASSRSFQRLRVSVPALQQVIDQLLRTKRFDVVNLEFPYLGHFDLRQSRPSARLPSLIVDSHEIAYDLERQFASCGGSPLRRLLAGINWRKLRKEELATYGTADGVFLCSKDDEQRLLKEVPGVPTAVIPNAADVEYYCPASAYPQPDGRTIVYFGLLSTIPNVDAVGYFVREVWPHIAEKHPEARFKIIGGRAPLSLLELAGPRVEFTGYVTDLRPHLAEAAAVVVPLRLGGGTRLKIVEAMAMGKAIVSTTLGAEGIKAIAQRDILIADQPTTFAHAVSRLLTDPVLAARIGQSARQLAEDQYAWSTAAQALESFYRRILGGGP